MLSRRTRLRNRLTAARLGNFGGRGFPYTASAMLAAAEPAADAATIMAWAGPRWYFDEAAASDDLADVSGSGYDLTQNNSPGVTGTGGRTFNSAAAQTFTPAAMDSTLGVINQDYSAGIVFTRTATGTRYMWSITDPGSANNHVFHVRVSGLGTGTLTLFIGDGAGTFGSLAIGNVDQTSKYSFAWTFTKATGAITWRLANLTTPASTTGGGTIANVSAALGSLSLVFGGYTNLFTGTIWRATMFPGRVLSAAELETHATDTTGV
jgi:hypothetical protein